MLEKITYNSGLLLLNIVSILLFALSTNILAYLIITPIIIYSSFWHFIILVLFSIFIGVLGVYVFYMYTELKKHKTFYYENRYILIKQNINEKEILIKRLESDMRQKYIFYFSLFISLSLLTSFIYLNNKQTISCFNDNDNLEERHSELELLMYDQLAECRGFYHYQKSIIDSVIDFDDNSLTLIDASSCLGKLQILFNRDTNYIYAEIIGCESSDYAINKCISNYGIHRNYIKKCIWTNLDSVFTEPNIADIIYLFNNTLPVLKDTLKAKEFFTDSYQILEPGGLLVFDFENIETIGEQVSCSSSKGVSRRVKINLKEKCCTVNLFHFDKNEDVDRTKYERCHNTDLMQTDNIIKTLNSAGFSLRQHIRKTSEYPFDIIIATKI